LYAIVPLKKSISPVSIYTYCVGGILEYGKSNF
jgi:hypothetical protein